MKKDSPQPSPPQAQRRPERPGTPIELYQSLYGRLHDLKGSAGLSAKPLSAETTRRIHRCDGILKSLAQDELEFPAASNTALAEIHRAFTGTQDLERLESCLNATLSLTQTIQHPPIPVLAEDFPWDALARARATSAARHGYGFVKRERRLTLPELAAYESELRAELAPKGGLDIVRRLTPEPGEPPRILVIQLIALPSEE